MTYLCTTCGETHDSFPDIGFDRPDLCWTVPEEERASRVELTGDTCVIDDEHFFIRGVIHIPVHGEAEHFGFGVWVSQKRENFLTYVRQNDTPDIGPFFGWLCTRLSCYDVDTLHLKTMAHFRGDGLRPSIEVERTDHPLSVDQHEGISLDTVWRVIHHFERKRSGA